MTKQQRSVVVPAIVGAILFTLLYHATNPIHPIGFWGMTGIGVLAGMVCLLLAPSGESE